jgi:hypothetical protein
MTYFPLEGKAPIDLSPTRMIVKDITVNPNIDERELRHVINQRVQEAWREKMRIEGVAPYPPQDGEPVDVLMIRVVFYRPRK